MIAVLLLLSKLFGFLSFRLIAGFFGTPRELDIFWTAYIIPDTIFNILIAGSINAAVIPVFMDIKVLQGKGKFVKLFIGTTLFFSVLLLGAIAIMFLLAPYIADFMLTNNIFNELGDGTSDLREGDTQLMVYIIRILLMTPFFLGLSSMTTAFLQTQKRFFITTAAFLVNNLVMLTVSFVLVLYFQMGVYGLAWGSVLGAFAHFLVQVPLTVQFIRKYMHISITRIDEIGGRLSFYTKEVWRIVSLAIPRTLTYALEQGNIIVNTLIGFSLGSGVLSAYKYAFQLHLFPVHIIVGAVSQVSLPNFSEEISKGQYGKFAEQYRGAVNQILFLMFPAGVILLVLRLPIVRLVYGVGEFDWWDTIVTSWALALLAGSLIAQGVNSITLRGLFALKKTWVPLMIALVALPLNIVLSYYLTNFFSHYQDWRPIIYQITLQLEAGATTSGPSGIWESLSMLFGDLGSWFTTRNQYNAAVGGLSLSLTITYFLEMILLVWALNRQIRVINLSLVKNIAKMALNSLLMMGVMYFIYRYTDFSLDTSQPENIVTIFIMTIIPGGIVYMLLSMLSDVKEVYAFTNSTLYFLGGIYDKLSALIDERDRSTDGKAK